MRIKVVILNWNGRGYLERFMPSVTRSTKGADIVVADNCSTDDSVDFLRASYPDVQLLQLDENYGYAGGYNKALELLDADAFVLLNSDIETPEGWLEPLAEMMCSDEKVACVAPKILSYAHKDHFEYAGAAGGYLDYFGYPFCRGRILKSIEQDAGQYDDAREIFWSSGACMLIRADVFRSLGGFDESFFAHMEEIDLCWRAHLAGYKVMSEPRSRVYHVGGGTLPNNSPHKLYLNYRNNLSMLYKNLPPASMRWVLFLRMFMDAMSAAVFMLQGRTDLFKVVFNAHSDFDRSRGELRIKRKAIQASRVKNHIPQIYRGSIVLRYMLGLRRFSDLSTKL